MTSFCKFCEKETEPFVIHEFQYWALVLNPRQYYLGRCFLMLNRHEEDLTNLEEEERSEIWTLIKTTKKTLDDLFSPDHY